MKITIGKPRRFDRTRRFFFGLPWPEKTFKQKASFIACWGLYAVVLVPILLGVSEAVQIKYGLPIIGLIWFGVPALLLIRWVNKKRKVPKN